MSTFKNQQLRITSGQQKSFVAAQASFALQTGLNPRPDDFAPLIAPADPASAKSGCPCLHTILHRSVQFSPEAGLLTDC
jgi:hypothetical protein